MKIMDKLKVVAQNDLKDQILELKNSNGTISTIRQGFMNLIDNTSHLTRNKIGVRVEYGQSSQIELIPINLASTVFLIEGILLKDILPPTGVVSVNDKEYFFDSKTKFGLLIEGAREPIKVELKQ